MFLLPLIIAYEVGLIVLAPPVQGEADRVIAYHLMEMFFSLFGATGVLLPGLLIIVILLATHVVSREPWRVRASTLLGMLGESLVWTMPLFVLNRTIRYAGTTGTFIDWRESLVIGTGAGVYEELVFRLVLVTVLVIILEDVLHFKKIHSLVAAVIIAAVLFAAHHHVPLGTEAYAFVPFLFRTLAGIYLGGLFLLRGYGVTAGCHAFYNVIVVTLEAIPTPS